MYEYEIENKNTNERNFVYGYNINDMKRRHPSINCNEWRIIFTEYID